MPEAKPVTHADESHEARLARMYQILSRTNRALQVASDELTLLGEICRTIVEVGGFRMAWVGLIDSDTGRVRPAARAGRDDGYLDSVDIRLQGERSQGPTGLAIRDCRTVICEDIATDPRMEPWRSRALERGYASSVGLPIVIGDDCHGVLTVYSDRPRRFDPGEVELLEELSRDLAMGLSRFREVHEHDQAQAALQASESRFTATAETLLDPFVIMRAERDSSGAIVDFVYQFANEAAGGAGRLDHLQMVGRRVLEIRPQLRGSRLFELYVQTIETGEPLVLDEFDFLDTRDGPEERFFDVRGRKVDDGIALTWRDVTERRLQERRRAEELEEKVQARTAELVAARERAAELARMSRAMIGATSPGQVAAELFETARRVCGAVDAAVGLVDPVDHGIKLIGTFGLDEETLAQIAALPIQVPTPIRDAGRFGRPVVFEGGASLAAEYPGWIEHAPHFGNLGRAAFPLRAGGTTVGAISLGFEPRQLSDEEVSFLLSLANAAALALESLRSGEAERRARGLLDAVVAQMPVGVTILDRDGETLYRNPDYDRIVSGAEAPAIDGEAANAGAPASVELAFQGRDGAPLSADQLPAVRSLKNGEVVVDEEARLVRPDGSVAVITQSSAPVRDEAGATVGAVAVTMDVTERRVAEQLRDAFLGVLSHEIRTPVTTISAGAQFLARKVEALDAETRLELLADIAAESERLDRMVDDLLVLGRAERGVDMTVHGPALIQHRLRAVVASFTATWPDRQFRLEMPDGLPPVVGEEAYLEHVFRNLVGNAAKYGRSKVEIRVDTDAERVTVQVEDDGPGVEESQQERVFELFARAAQTSSLPGAGIGLFVVRRLVTAMGGSVSLANRQEGGARISVMLNRYLESADEASA